MSLNPAAGIALGVDFGRRHLRVAVADLAHAVLGEAHVAMPTDYTADTGLSRAEALIQQVCAEAGVEAPRSWVSAWDWLLPSSRRAGLVGQTSILPGWVGVAPGPALSRRLHVAVSVDNDANLGALAEAAWGAGTDCDDLVYVKVATGIGAGILVDGALHRGAGGMAGEIGHMVFDEEGPMCRCGNRGCLETYAAGPALLRLVAADGGTTTTLQDLLARAATGDAGSRRAIVDSARLIGRAIANVCNLLAPECVVVGGDMASAGDLFFDPLREAFSRNVLRTSAPPARIERGLLGERAEVLGGIALVLRENDQLSIPPAAAVTQEATALI